jgi:hypothetical protein
MTELEKLLASEEIKRVKARYFYCLDHKDWAGWKRDVFAADARLHVPEFRPEPFVGIDTIIAWVAQAAGNQISVHHGHMPDIEILSADTAKGIWAMEDTLRYPMDRPGAYGYTYLHGYGHYHETYVRTSAGWRIQSTRLERLYVEQRQVALNQLRSPAD